MHQGGSIHAYAAVLIGTLIYGSAAAASEPPALLPVAAGYSEGDAPRQGQLYPRLNAPLYPAPVQYTPPWNGATIITNQALAPHEMLYPHEYRAMYPPFYHRVTGHWIVTPLGVKQNETWKLQGTEVRVRYRSHRTPFAHFFVPPH